MNVEKLKEVFAEEAFVKALFEMEAVADMQAALKEKGVEMSEEEVSALRTLFDKVKSGDISREQLEKWQTLAEKGELSEDALEQVAGGSLTIIAGMAAAAFFAAMFIATFTEPV